MENKQLEQEHFDAIDRAAHEQQFDAVTDGKVLYDDEFSDVAKANSSITIKHMKGFGDYISREYNIEDGIGYFSDFGLDENNQSIEQKYYTTEQLIKLYFDSLNR